MPIEFMWVGGVLVAALGTLIFALVGGPEPATRSTRLQAASGKTLPEKR